MWFLQSIFRVDGIAVRLERNTDKTLKGEAYEQDWYAEDVDQ